MRRRTDPSTFAPAAALAALAAALLAALLPATAGAGLRALTGNGDVYFVESGRYAELFPEGGEAGDDDAVLAVSVLRGDGSAERLLVPETAGPEVETAAALVAGPNGAAVYLLWEAGTELSRLRLARLDADGWGEPVDVSRGSAVVAGSPKVMATRDRSLLTGGTGGEEGEAVLSHRSVLHVAWLEDPAEAVYAPVVIEDGTYLGDHALFDLGRFAPEPPAAEPGAPAPEPPAVAARPLLTLEPGQEGAAVAAFTDPETGELVSLELRPVAGELSEIGDRVRDGIVDLTRQLEPGDPDSLESLAGGARAQLINVGHQLRPAVLGVLAAEIEGYVLETGGDWAFQPDVMAARTRNHLISVGASFDHTSISNLHGGARAQLINVGHHLEGPERSHDLSVRVAASRPVPELPPEAVSAVYLSASGAAALVAWEQEGLVHYLESEGEGWSEPITLGIEASADPDLVDDLLTDRVRGQ